MAYGNGKLTDAELETAIMDILESKESTKIVKKQEDKVMRKELNNKTSESIKSTRVIKPTTTNKTMVNKKLDKSIPEEFGKIFKTTDYKMFKTIGSNRKINPVNYGKLLRSMKEEQLIIPICVNEKYEVIDGQHRLKVCEELGLPVYYYLLVGYSTAQMKRANLVSANWTKDDFLHAYVSDDIESYAVFNTLKEKYGLNTSDLIRIIAKIQGTSAAAIGLDFEEGRLNFSIEDRAALKAFLVALDDFKFFKEYKKTKFVSAFLELYFFSGYSHSQMKTRLKTRDKALEIQLTKDDYIQLLANKIYSFGNTTNNIYYDSDRKKIYTID